MTYFVTCFINMLELDPNEQEKIIGPAVPEKTHQ